MPVTSKITGDPINAANNNGSFDGQTSIPAFARKYAAEHAIVAAEAQCIQFLPSDVDRRFPVRITMRSATCGKAPWYEIETYHVNVKRWVVRQTETKRELAFDVAQAMRLTDEPDDEDGYQD